MAIAEYAAQASVKRAEGEAKAKTTNAEADAGVIKLVGGAEAEKTQKIGLAEAAVIKQKAEAINRESVEPEVVVPAQQGGIATAPDALEVLTRGRPHDVLIEPVVMLWAPGPLE